MSGNTDIETGDTDFMEICASEDLSHMGLIQSHGCLIAVDAHGKIQAASENTNLLLGQSPDDLLGADASDLLLPDGESAATTIKRMGPVDDEVVSARCPRGSRTPLDLICHRSDDAVILEIVEPGGADNTKCPDISDDLKAIEKAPNSYSAAAMTVKSIRRLTGYDRSMVYRFLPDATGDVIAESREEKLTPYLGLRYPGSDIPVNARQLYLKTPIRIVADARSTPVPVKTLGGQACNLGLARLRSVSRYHIEYLQNMGVTATLVTSIIVDGSLWGLVACLHYSATMVTAAVQEKCIQLTRALSRRIETLEQEETARLSGVVEQKTALFIEEMKMLQSLWYTALFGRNRLIRSLEIHGCAIQMGDEIYSLGYCPPPSKTWEIIRHIASVYDGDGSQSDAAVWSCTNIKSIVGAFDGPTAGVAYARVDSGPEIGILLYRNEMKREIYWGGNPDKAVSLDKETQRLNPRKSFEAWATQVTDVAEEWNYIEIEMLRRLADELAGFPDDVLHATTPEQNPISHNFADIIFDASKSDIRSVIDDFVPEGIATIAYRISPSDTAMTGFANSAFYKFLGVTRRDSTDTDVDSLLELLGLPRSILELKSNQEKTVEFISPVSGQRMLRIRNLDLICRHNEDGHAEGLGIVYLHDETERQRIIEALDAARRQHEVNSSFRTEILGGLSHELRTPLNAIIGYSELLTSVLQELNDEKPKEYAATVLDAGRQMLGLVEGLLDISKIERGVLQIDEALIDVRKELMTSINIASEHAARHSQSIELAFNPGPVQIMGDARAFRQIFINLLSNSVKFSPPGSSIKITVDLTRMESLEVKVEDSGPGIDPKYRALIFEPFSQIEGVESRSRPGAGIGLSIVKAYTELHGGIVSISDASLGGAMFTIRFPSWRVKTA
ncbi:MAG TPA: hypothetical protein DEB21_13275 [Rhodospirillaceae bacterium]|nr:hypothetical protein [Rhodospirillaceae bacterium]